MEKYTTLIYGKKNIKVDFYKDGNQYYMISEDIGRCFDYSNPRLQLNNYILAHPEVKSDEYSVLAKIPGMRSNGVRCFTRRGATLLANLKGERELQEWLNFIFDGLESGRIETVSAEEDYSGVVYGENEALPISPELNMTNYQRAQILLEAAKISEKGESFRLKSAAMLLLLNHNFEEVYNKYLTEYGELL